MNQHLVNHDLALLKLERLHQDARTHDLLQHSQHQTVSGWSPNLARFRSLGMTLTRRILHVLHGSPAPH